MELMKQLLAFEQKKLKIQEAKNKEGWFVFKGTDPIEGPLDSKSEAKQLASEYRDTTIRYGKIEHDEFSEIKKPSLNEEKLDDMDLGELLDKFIDDNKLYRFEGHRGAENFKKVVGAIGYRSTDDFFEDNSGAYEAIIEWIKDRNSSEWVEALKEVVADDKNDGED